MYRWFVECGVVLICMVDYLIVIDVCLVEILCGVVGDGWLVIGM